VEQNTTLVVTVLRKILGKTFVVPESAIDK